ncbi:MAG TPA: amidohydrolase family protein [Candidatus Acidoferrum sp.]|nr:amidohydrolase family protein [Candidatus Acidoferrum sp.]
MSRFLSNRVSHKIAASAVASFLLLFAFPGDAPAQNAANGVYAIRGAEIFTISGAPIEHGVVVIRDGKIAAVGADVPVPADAQVIDGSGLQVYPGMFDPVTQIGLEEVEAVRATEDTNETGEFNPDVTAATAFNADSSHVDVTRAAGITEVLTVPGALGGFGGGGSNSVIGGNASAVNLGGWNINDMAIKRHAAMELTWPSISTGSFDLTTFTFRQLPFDQAKKQYQAKVDALSDLFDQARHYATAMKGGATDFPRNLKLEALVPVVEGNEPLLVVAFSERDIRNAVDFCEKQKVRMILGGATEAWKTTDLLKKDDIPVIVGPILSIPQTDDDPYDAAYAMPAQLHEAGIKIAFASFNTSFSRRLPQYAGTAVGYGLPRDEALKAVTVNAAQMLGLGDIGTIEPGKVANVVVTDGDLLELRTHVKYLFIKGQMTSLDNKQLDLYQRYSHRPKPARD